MTILTERVTWKKPRPATETRRASDLTPEEQAHIRAALRWLRIRLGGNVKLAEALKISPKAVEKTCAPSGRPSAALAIRAARIAGASVEDVLSGKWPKAGSCPMCGRGG